MKIEIDTKHDTKEELKHLAAMLHALAGSQTSSIVSDSRFPDPRDDRLQRKLERKGIFDDDPSTPPTGPSPASGGLFSLFNDDAPSQSAESAEPEPASSAGDLFSMFSSEPAPSAPIAPSASSLLGETLSAQSSPALLDPYGGTEEAQPESDDGKSAQELLDDDRIVPY